MQSDTAIEIRVGYLLERQLDIAANRATANFFRPAIRRFHYAWTTASHHCESEPGYRRAHFSGQLVMRIVRLDAGRPKDRYARSHKMKRAKSAQEIAHHSQQCKKLCEARARTFQENFVCPLWWSSQRGCRRI